MFLQVSVCPQGGFSIWGVLNPGGVSIRGGSPSRGFSIWGSSPSWGVLHPGGFSIGGWVVSPSGGVLHPRGGSPSGGFSIGGLSIRGGSPSQGGLSIGGLSLRSMRRQYASYWNAFLLHLFVCLHGVTVTGLNFEITFVNNTLSSTTCFKYCISLNFRPSIMEFPTGHLALCNRIYLSGCSQFKQVGTRSNQLDLVPVRMI